MTQIDTTPTGCPYGEIDVEVQPLVRAMNSVSKRIYTIESCAGHGKHPVYIWFLCHRLSELPKLLYWFDG